MDSQLKDVKKYLGSCCGNSFVILDCRNKIIEKKQKAEFALKNIDHYGVDSALYIGDAKDFEVSIEIFEKDGSESDSCGNGIILIAHLLGLKRGARIKMKNSTVLIDSDTEKLAIKMYLKSSHVEHLGTEANCLFVKMGEPHIIYIMENISGFDLQKAGEFWQKKYAGGVNVDVIQKITDASYKIRTYERGVFAETKSCGTGSLSSFIAISHFHGKIYYEPIEFQSTGGSHWVSKSDDMLKLETLKNFCKIQIIE